MRKRPETVTNRRPARSQPVFSDDPALDDPHDAIDQELLGIWLSISRLRELILSRPRRRAPIKTAVPSRKQPRRKAA
jgi:hypothetical protein